MRLPHLASALVLSLLACPAVFAADPANVNARAAASHAEPLPPGLSPGLSPEVQREMQRLLSSLPPGPTGDAATACEVILCLAGSAGAGGSVAACVPPIRKYLTSFTPPRLFTKRLNFLKLCPKTSGQGDARMDSLVEILARAPGADGDGRLCSAATMNRVNRRLLGEGEYYIASDMPRDCEAYYGHEYTDLEAAVPVYIGEPLEGGFWAENKDARAAQARYDAEREARRRAIDDGDPRPPRRSAYSTL